MMNEYSSIALQNDSPSNHKSSGRCSVHLTLNLSDSSDCYETHKTTAANFSSSPYTMSLWERGGRQFIENFIKHAREEIFDTFKSMYRANFGSHAKIWHRNATHWHLRGFGERENLSMTLRQFSFLFFFLLLQWTLFHMMMMTMMMQEHKNTNFSSMHKTRCWVSEWLLVENEYDPREMGYSAVCT